MKEFFWCIEYVATFIEIFMCSYFCGTFVAKEKLSGSKNKIVLLSTIASVIVFILNHINLFSYITTGIFILLCIAIQCVSYREKYLLSIGLVVAYAAILSAIDFIIIYIVAVVIDTNTGYILSEQSFIRLICILLSKSILSILVLTLNRVIAHKKTIPPLYIAIMGVCSAFLLISNLVLIHSELDKTNDEISSFTMFFFIASLGIEMIIFGFVIKIAEGYEQKKTNLLIELNNKMLQKSLDETEQTFELWRQSIHDYKNDIIALTQLAEEEKLEEIKTFLHKENKLIEQKMFYIKTGNSVVDAIINTKQNIAEKQNIVFVVNIELPPRNIVSNIDMANILGNLIDNAIEAAGVETESFVEITIKQEKSFLIINIKNKCTKLIEIEEIKTSKRDSEFHGIGLRSVRRTVKKYDGQMAMYIKNEEFNTNILIQNKID